MRPKAEHQFNAKLNPHKILVVAPAAVLLVFHVKGLFPVVTFAAEVAFVDAGHVHFVRTLGHLEDLVVTTGALEAFFVNMFVVAEDDDGCVLGREGNVTPADLLGRRGEW